MTRASLAAFALFAFATQGFSAEPSPLLLFLGEGHAEKAETTTQPDEQEKSDEGAQEEVVEG